MIIKFENVDDACLEIQLACKRHSVGDIAEGAGVSTATVRRWRDKPMQRPHLKIFIKLANYFGFEVSMKELMRLAA